MFAVGSCWRIRLRIVWTERSTSAFSIFSLPTLARVVFPPTEPSPPMFATSPLAKAKAISATKPRVMATPHLDWKKLRKD